ncbi:MAG: DMT family transporter [Bacteroidales bacterium]|nr:DMT family transporter [Bacteroidales bacterium]
MAYIGEIISLAVAAMWTTNAIITDFAVKRQPVLVVNVWRMILTIVISVGFAWVLSGSSLLEYTNLPTWAWLFFSGIIGYSFGDFCLLSSYKHIGPRFGQLFMTLSPMSAAFAAWVFLGQDLSWKSLVAMIVTLAGIAITILGRGKGHSVKLELPLKGVLFGIGAGLGQGFGLVFSKIGMNHFADGIPAEILDQVSNIYPFSANVIRSIGGLLGFIILLNIFGTPGDFRKSASDHKGMLLIFLAVILGPAVGVAGSLIAVNYVEAGIASTLMATTPIMILIPAYFIFHQEITFKSIVGAIIAVIGVSLFFLL